MNCILIKNGKDYPVVETAVYTDGGCITKVHVSTILDPDHVELDNPQYIENKYKKLIPALESIGVTHNEETKEQSINVTMAIKGKFNSVNDINNLAKMGTIVASIAEDRLSEPAVIKAIGKDCKPWFEDEEQRNEGE